MSKGFYVRTEKFQQDYLDLLYSKLTIMQKITFKISFQKKLSFKDMELAIDYCECVIEGNRINGK